MDTGCAITAAVCNHFPAAGAEDMSLLKGLHDDYLLSNEERMAEVQRYFWDGPGLVQRLDADPHSHDIYSVLRENYITPAARSVKRGEMDLAFVIYRAGLRFVETLLGPGV